MQTHAARTKHVNFSESTEDIKPLTDEEKKAQVARYDFELVAFQVNEWYTQCC
jgi:hypothetical protein